MAARAKAKQPAKKRQQRATSNIFAMFDQSQIKEFKEAFNIIDHDRVRYENFGFFFIVFLIRILLGWLY